MMKRPSNAQELMALIKQQTNGEKGTLEDAVWFVAISEARNLSENCSLRDLANCIIGGIKISTEEDVNEWLASLDMEDDVDAQQDVDDEFIENFVDFYAK